MLFSEEKLNVSTWDLEDLDEDMVRGLAVYAGLY